MDTVCGLTVKICTGRDYGNPAKMEKSVRDFCCNVAVFCYMVHVHQLVYLLSISFKCIYLTPLHGNAN